MTPYDIPALRDAAGSEIGVSRWHVIEQDRVSEFASVTEDHQYIHTDPRRAARSPFGGTIAHGFLPLSLLSAMFFEAVGTVGGTEMSMNYGFDRIRFLSPVPTGRKVRARFRLADVTERPDGSVLLRLATSIELDGAARPAVVADWLVLLVPAQPSIR